ncbi:lysozyme [Streptomyces sulfonofaciens]|nr:lysozyme [Streptomyces sulfonofaciens]
MACDHRPLPRRTRFLTASAAVLAAGSLSLAPAEASAAARPRGHDVSSHQGSVGWPTARANGARFTYVKATEATSYTNSYFTRQFNGARSAGMLHGAYHFALPDRSSGKSQAAYFVRHGGRWRADGWTLPPALDIERDPYSTRTCYGLSRSGMVSWIRSFSDEVNRRTGRRPVIYTSTRWWNTCTGGSRAFAAQHPLWVARYAASAGALPAGWAYWTFWQYADGGSLPGDQDLFNGSMTQLRRLARG